MDPRNREALEAKVAQAATAALAAKKFVAPIDIFIGLGWLTPVNLNAWRQGRAPFLEAVVQVNLSKISEAMTALRAWAQQSGLKPSETGYVRKGVALRFSKSGAPKIEQAYRTHWVSQALVDAKRARAEAASATEEASSASLTKT